MLTHWVYLDLFSCIAGAHLCGPGMEESGPGKGLVLLECMFWPHENFWVRAISHK